MAMRADSTFGIPMRSLVCRICRCRLLRSTTSWSTMPSVPRQPRRHWEVTLAKPRFLADVEHRRAVAPLHAVAYLLDAHFRHVAPGLFHQLFERLCHRTPLRAPLRTLDLERGPQLGDQPIGP